MDVIIPDKVARKRRILYRAGCRRLGSWEGSRVKRHLISACAFLIIAGSTAAALANGAWSEFPAGGVVVFKPEKMIRIDREDLEIGWKLIRVRYVFYSSANEPVERTIGFPMAKVPLDDSPDNFEDRSWAKDGDEPRNYMAFKVAVNGKSLAPKFHEYAWFDETNITSKLLAMGVPVHAASAEAFEKLAELPGETTRSLRRQHLVQDDEPDTWLVPRWKYQTVYEWTQTFAPGKTVVEISYKPLYGSYYGPEPYYAEGSRSAEYCYDNATRQKLAGERGLPIPFTVGYILKTANYWNGPIREFHLKISRDEGDLVRFCVPEGLKAVGDGQSWEAEDFVPRSDLNIVFFARNP